MLIQINGEITKNADVSVKKKYICKKYYAIILLNVIAKI